MSKAAEKPQEINSKKPDENKAELRKADEDPVGKVYDSRLIKRLGHYLRPYWWQAAISSLSISLKSMSDVAGPYLVMVGIDRYFPTGKGSREPRCSAMKADQPASSSATCLPTPCKASPAWH